MAFFNILKQAEDFLSGGGAKIYLEFNKKYYLVNEEIKMLVIAEVGQRDFYTNSVYLQIKGEEKTKVNINTGSSHHTETKKYTSYKKTFQVSEGEGLKANTHYEWMLSFHLPEESLPTYIGKNASHKWYARAGLNVTGKDPICKWNEFLFFQSLKSAPSTF